MSTRIWDRARRRAMGFAVAAVATGALTATLLIGFAVPDGWWPTTGQAFASSAPETGAGADDPCDLVVGPAKDYCRGQGLLQGAAPAPEFDAVDAWMLLPPAVGILALTAYRLRSARRP
ncbi:hypothetical protein [Streptomyces sp. KLOTTS4A1]|uniref:hypothetical protein n=1 Tax=Streptomyces sp. KLOTTS4A1 TaxID=3390996 RepID=UPI0039F45464